MKTKLTIFVLIFLLGLQLIYGFLFPSCGSNDNWQPIATYLPKFQIESSDNLLLNKIYPLISKDYRLNSDVGHYLELGRNFSPQYFEGNPFLERPLYPFLIFSSSLPVRLFTDISYGLTFGLAILVNFILISLAVILFFWLLKTLFSLKVAWLSSVLLIFSPFVHNYLNQPLAEMLMAFAVVLSAYLLHCYVKKPSTFKLIIFSLVIGVLMFGKMFFAISFFILLLAVYFKRYREGAVFLIIHLLPFLFWYLWVTQVWQINYYAHQVQGWHMGVWVFDIMRWPWQETFQFFLGLLPNFITAIIFSFLLIPIFFSVVGFKSLPFKSKNIIYFGSIFAVFLLGFLTKFYYLRHVFLLFPIIYPTAVLGMIRIADYLKWHRVWLVPLFYVIVISAIILISNTNIYQIFNYNH